MKKKISIILLMFTIISSLLVIPAIAASSNIPIFFDGVPLKTSAVQKNGTIFAPFRAVFEKMGMQVTVDAKSGSVTGSKKGIKITFFKGSKTAYVNGVKKSLNAAPFIASGTTYVPLRIIGESTGMNVYWTKEANLVQVNSPSFKGVSYTLADGSSITFKANGSVVIGKGEYSVYEKDLAERKAIEDFISNVNYRIVGEAPTAEESLKPGYKGYPDYFDENYQNALAEKRTEIPPLMSEGWISQGMLAEIEKVNRVSSDDPNILTFARSDKESAYGIFRYDIAITDEYRKATKGDFVLSDIRVKKYYGNMFLNIEDLKKVGIIIE